MTVFIQEIAPTPILRAGLDTVSWACIYGRNQTLQNDCDIKKINELMEAVHEVPRMLMSWTPDRLRELRIHLGCFTSSRYPGAPDLVAYFDSRHDEYTRAEQGADDQAAAAVE